LKIFFSKKKASKLTQTRAGFFFFGDDFFRFAELTGDFSSIGGIDESQ